MTAEALAAVPETESRVIIATGSYIDEGFDDPRLHTLFLAMPIPGRVRFSSTWGNCIGFIIVSVSCRFTTEAKAFHNYFFLLCTCVRNYDAT